MVKQLVLILSAFLLELKCHPWIFYVHICSCVYIYINFLTILLTNEKRFINRIQRKVSDGRREITLTWGVLWIATDCITTVHGTLQTEAHFHLLDRRRVWKEHSLSSQALWYVCSQASHRLFNSRKHVNGTTPILITKLCFPAISIHSFKWSHSWEALFILEVKMHTEKKNLPTFVHLLLTDMHSL